MRKILLAALALFVITGSGFAQNLPSYVPANGLVGWWPFNGNANDESGNGNNGTVNGATLTADRFGNIGSAYSFNGSSNWIQVEDHPTLRLKLGTVSVWVKYQSAVKMQLLARQDIVDPYSYPSNYGFEMNETTGPRVQGMYGDSCTPNQIYWTSFSPQINLGDNQWHHIVGHYDTAMIKLFIDGELIDSLAATSAVMGGCPGAELLIGRGWTQFPLWYDGLIDDLAIFNRPLKNHEISSLYQSANTTANCPDLPSNLQQGLVGYWPFCGNANDESGHGNNGTVNGATLTADRFGNQGSAFSFDGVEDFIELPPVLPAQNQSYSVNFWAYVIPDSGRVESYTVFDDRNQSSFNSKGRFLILGSNPRKYWYQMGDNPQCTGSDTPSELWVNFTCIYDNARDSIFVFKNGVLDCSTYNPDASFFPGLRKLWIGKGQSPEFISVEEWHGMIDDFGVWNRILTQSEITQLYNQGICQQSITVTDTLLIHTGITSYNPIAYQNTLKVWPNPGNQDITIDAGNLSLMQGWKIKISNSLGQEVYPATLISQQQQLLDMSTWGGNGLYLLHLINPQGHITEVKKIVLAP